MRRTTQLSALPADERTAPGQSIDSEPDTEALAEIRLALVPGIGPRLRQALIDRFGSASAIFAAAPDQLRAVEGIGPKLTRALSAATDDGAAREELALCRRHGVELLLSSRPGYPRALAEIHDPPGLLYAAGEIRSCDALAVAIVGSRHATHYGLEQAERLAASLARAGVTVVSGMARGIDGAAHRAALEAGGRTIAVLGSGLLELYPPEHLGLAEKIRRQGAVLSELPLRTKPLAGTFPQRNRLISGLSMGIIVVEASQRSGALITARHAAEQGRDVFAVPGRVDNRMSQGCHRLIRDGAKLVETVDDVLEELGPLVAATEGPNGEELRHPAELLLNEIEQQVLAAIRSEVTTIDAVVETSGLEVSRVLATISALEVRRLIRRVSGNAVRRV
ncbi:MAG: DNA-processing protein DprA [Pirellulales bacterium]|nr:DNA-processing protein DprA [Pirellulales bacterium]